MQPQRKAPMSHYKSILAFFINAVILITFGGCEDKRASIKIEPVEVNQDLKRMDVDIFGERITNYDSLNQALLQQYGTFYDIVINRIANITDPANPQAGMYIKQFVEYQGIQETGQKLVADFSDFESYFLQIHQGFERYKAAFPDSVVPTVITFFSVFNYAVVATDSVLGIGLDMYLGKDFEYYPTMGFPMYKIEKMDKKYLVSDALKGWLQTTFDEDLSQADLFTMMVHHGKILYALDAFLPEIDATIKFGFSPEQLEWCRQNEFNMWAHFVDNNLLYSKEKAQIMKFMNEGPFTSGFDKASPAQTGVWMGYQIVVAYMRENKEVTLQTLFSKHNAQEILARSKYKPTK